MAADNVARDAFNKDFDDDDDDDVDDDDDDDDDNNGLHAIHAIQQHNTFNSRPRHELEGIIEQLVGDEFVAPYTDLLPMAKSSPALPVSDSSTDNPYSTSTFNARLHPQPIIRVQDTPKGKEGRKQRPWSQVIWESPIMDGSIAPPQRVYDHAATVGGKYESYPALTKDLFTQRTPDMIISKSVRINIDAPDTPPIPRRSVRTPERSSHGATLLPVPATGRREFSHSRKHAHRLSLGSGFYATLEPVNLAAATPTTPKAKRQLVRLPARPQSVFIPTTSIQKQGTLQVEDTTRRCRHQSQQLEMRRPVPIPWVQLVPMSAQDNARTFHGIGTGLPVENALETSTSCSALEGTTSTVASSSSSSTSSSSAGSPSLPTQEPWARSSPSPGTTTPSRTRRTMATTSLTPKKHSPHHNRNRVPSSSNSTSWKKSPSVLFPFSLISHESSSFLGIKNTGTIVSTGVPVVVPISFPTPPNMPAISLTPSCGSIEWFPGSSASSPSGGSGGEGAAAEILLEKTGFGDQTGLQSTLPNDHYATYQLHDGVSSSTSSLPEHLFLEDGSEVLLQKSHVAVYEVNARWGSRLAMVLVSLGGLLCAVSGGLCAEHNCSELQFCEDGHASHGNWCGPSGVDGAPYMLTVGLSMWTFGLYALSHLRTPTSRLVGYSEID
ncbi:hypothetical protein BG006_008521 [Podila minutissima]|uniref:Uncharacterized protein n=1 Tax=Podila minutissima TaxID=64525 RepID=A0A9P5VJX1_9FUNG|nr:hypothetical protein BG006_008521 [Podila minutissima]